MYDNLRLTELHEEWATLAFATRELARSGEFVRADRKHQEVLALEREIDARVARQEIGYPYLPWNEWDEPSLSPQRDLWGGVPDAERVYPRKGKSVDDEHWTYQGSWR